MGAPTDLGEYRTKLAALLETANLPTNIAPSSTADGDLDDILASSVREYSTDKPRKRVKEYTGDGTLQRFVLTGVAADWQPEFSAILTIRRRDPLNATDLGRPLTGEEFAVMQELDPGDLDIDVIYLTFAPPATEQLDVLYTAPHTLSASDSSIYHLHTYSVLHLAASEGALWIAERASDMRDASIEADAVDYGSISENYRAMATRWRERYEKVVLGSGKERGPSSAVVPMEDRPGRWNTHGRRPSRY